MIVLPDIEVTETEIVGKIVCVDWRKGCTIKYYGKSIIPVILKYMEETNSTLFISDKYITEKDLRRYINESWNKEVKNVSYAHIKYSGTIISSDSDKLEIIVKPKYYSSAANAVAHFLWNICDRINQVF